LILHCSVCRFRCRRHRRWNPVHVRCLRIGTLERHCCLRYSLRSRDDPFCGVVRVPARKALLPDNRQDSDNRDPRDAMIWGRGGWVGGVWGGLLACLSRHLPGASRYLLPGAPRAAAQARRC
jgi:hypothetical protein